VRFGNVLYSIAEVEHSDIVPRVRLIFFGGAH